MIRTLALVGLVVGVGRADANPSPYIYVDRCTGGCVLDLTVAAYDDIGTVGTSTITVTKGAAGGCTSDSACLADQQCDEGRCEWIATNHRVGGCSVGGASGAPITLALGLAFAIRRRGRRFTG